MTRMVCKLRFLSLALGTSVWFTVTLAFASNAQSQDPGAPGTAPATQSPSPPSQDEKKSGDSSSKDSVEPVDISAPPSSTVNAIGSASPLGQPNGFLRWGDFFVRDVSYTQAYEVSNYHEQSSPNLTGSSESNNTSLFETTLAFNHVSQNNQVALQFQPRLAIINGNVFPDLSNQNVSFNWLVSQNSRWSMDLHDNFAYFSSQNLYATYYADVNAQTGTAIQNNFLDGPGTLLSNAAGLSISYRWSPRTTLSFAPQFQYTRTTGTQSGTLISRNYGGAVTLGYQLSARQTIGVLFSSQYLEVSGVPMNTQYYSTGLTYSRQMGPSWTVSGTLAATLTPGAGIANPWTYTATASLTRQLQRGSAGIVYSRDVAMGYVTNQFADRIDAVASWQLTRNLGSSVSGGYQNQNQGSNPISGYYTASQLSWRLAPRVSAYVSYGYRMQNGDAIRILKGHSNTVGGGIRWESGPSRPY